MSEQRIAVVVAVIRDHQGQVLVAKRKHHQHQGDCWEFPGGKMESGESQAAALKRELREEVGIEVIDHFPWLDISHDYPDKAVRLHVHQITTFHGKAHGREGQRIAWYFPQILLSLSLPKANEVIVQALKKTDFALDL